MFSYNLWQGNNYPRKSRVVTPAEVLPCILTDLIEIQSEGTVVVSGSPNEDDLKIYQVRRKGITLSRLDIPDFLDVLLFLDQLPGEPQLPHTITYPSQSVDESLTLTFQKSQVPGLVRAVEEVATYNGPLNPYSQIVHDWRPADN